MRSLIITLVCTSILLGCGSTNNKGDLKAVNTNLRNQIALEEQKNTQLRADNILLNRKIETLDQVITVLDTEKGSRVEESSVLRSQVRKFVQNQVDVLKAFLVEGRLLDYIGGELVERSNVENKPSTIVDLGNKITSAGVLTGVGAYVMQPTSMKVKILRLIDKKLVVIWESNIINMTTVGISRHQFANSIGVERGDVIAYEFNKNVGIGYNIGTSNSRYTNDPLTFGMSISVNSLLGKKDKRSYSMGVYGLLNQ
ncbi:MAG: hypothetical protein HRT37_17835 [Alteromonadaceae bacterium]|nr:hypothetical protein [Alteromonadaceae bacterium]